MLGWGPPWLWPGRAGWTDTGAGAEDVCPAQTAGLPDCPRTPAVCLQPRASSRSSGTRREKPWCGATDDEKMKTIRAG